MADEDDIEKSEVMQEMEKARKSREEIDSEIGDVFDHWNFLRERIKIRIGNDKFLEGPVQQMLATALTVAFEEVVVRELEIDSVIGNDQDS